MSKPMKPWPCPFCGGDAKVRPIIERIQDAQLTAHVLIAEIRRDYERNYRDTILPDEVREKSGICLRDSVDHLLSGRQNYETSRMLKIFSTFIKHGVLVRKTRHEEKPEAAHPEEAQSEGCEEG